MTKKVLGAFHPTPRGLTAGNAMKACTLDTRVFSILIAGISSMDWDEKPPALS